ncbi:MAG: 1-acyl-sn-glycerol-3-phosphate acyltransferase, partial [Muribaculaceae bacterium]|nr:1-acyl-sn-glycerol-3-phosphate acyltransferase [Muribaculaceae bacterium]
MIRIDVDAVLRQKMPRHYRYIPQFAIRKLSRIVCEDRLNEMLSVNDGKEGSAFCRGVIDHLHINLREYGVQHLDPSNPRIVIVCNHPLGGLDGMAMIDIVARRMGREPWFVVNDLLMAITPLRPVFLPVNKFGSQGRDAIRKLDEAMASDRPLIIFPAGLVSRKGKKGVIADLPWQRSIVNKCIEYQRNVVPA